MDITAEPPTAERSRPGRTGGRDGSATHPMVEADGEGTVTAGVGVATSGKGCRADGRMNSIWRTSVYRSKWKMAQRKGYRIGQLTSDPQRKTMLRQHALDCQTNIPLSMECMIEKEALAVLQLTLKDYKHKLSSSHPLTAELQDRISTLKARLAARGAEPQTVEPRGVLETLQGCGRNLVSRLGSWDMCRHGDG